MARKISKKRFEWLQKELNYYNKQGVINDEQLNSILSIYTVETNSFNFMKLMVIIGSILMGLGVLSFIASNWGHMSKTFKFFMILIGFATINITGYKISSQYPKTGRSLIYLSLIVFGSGIFLIGQMFNYGGHFTEAFLLWGIGILPSAVVLKDKLLLIFTHIVLIVFLNGHFVTDQVPLLLIIFLPVLYYVNIKLFNNSGVVMFFTNIFAVNYIAFWLIEFNITHQWFLLSLFGLGLLMYFFSPEVNRIVFKVQGQLLMGIPGIFLTFKHFWEIETINSSTLSITFTILFLVLLLYLIKRESLTAIGLFCITIFRIYADTMYDFMPKSLFFLTSGLILLGSGYYIEKRRREIRGNYHDIK